MTNHFPRRPPYWIWRNFDKIFTRSGLTRGPQAKGTGELQAPAPGRTCHITYPQGSDIWLVLEIIRIISNKIKVSQIRYLKLPVWPTQPHIEAEPEIFSKPRLRPLIVADANEDFYERFVTCGSNYR